MLLVVDAGVEAEFLRHVPAFVGATGEANCPRTAHLGELADRAAYRPAGRTHHDSLARLGFDDPVEAIPCSHARHADRAEIGGQGNAARVHFAQATELRDGHALVQLPAAHAHHRVPDRESRVLRRRDLAYGAADHDFVERL
ncbi:hypothetical protein D3C80_1455970 [compost metagenome]